MTRPRPHPAPPIRPSKDSRVNRFCESRHQYRFRRNDAYSSSRCACHRNSSHRTKGTSSSSVLSKQAHASAHCHVNVSFWPRSYQTASGWAHRSKVKQAPLHRRRRLGGRLLHASRTIPCESTKATSMDRRMNHVWISEHGTRTSTPFHAAWAVSPRNRETGVQATHMGSPTKEADAYSPFPPRPSAG